MRHNLYFLILWWMIFNNTVNEFLIVVKIKIKSIDIVEKYFALAIILGIIEWNVRNVHRKSPSIV